MIILLYFKMNNYIIKMTWCPWFKKSKVEEVKEQIEDLADDVQEHVEEFVEEVKDDVKEHVEELVENVKEDANDFIEEAKDDIEEIVTEFVEEAVDEVKDKIFESLTKKDIEENEVVTEMPENKEDDMITETAESVVEESVSEGLNNVTEFIKEDDDKFEMPEVNNNLDDIYGSVRTKDCNSCTEEKIFYNTNDSIIPDNCDKCKYKYIN